MKHIYSLIGSFTFLKTMLRLLILVNGIILIPTISKGQNVGINQASPETKLHINTVEPSTLDDVLKLDNGGGTQGTETGLVFETGVDRVARISASNEGGDRGPLKFWTTISVDNLVERMRITQDGYVGIGTTTPTSVLEIAKAQDNLLRIWRADNSNADINFLFSANRNGGDKLDIGQIKSIYENSGFGIENSAMAFHTMNVGTLSEKVRITKNGNVGIGTVAPAEKLHVYNGNIAINNSYKFKFSGSDSNWQLGYESGSPSSSFFGFTAAVLQTVYGDDPNYGYIIENTQGNSIFEIEGKTGKAYLAGNVGVGIAPEAKMHINGNTSGTIQDVLKLDNEPSAIGTETGLVFEAGSDRLARISASHENSDRGPLKFWTTSTKDNLMERMRISQDGVVRVNDLAGTGTRFVVTDANGNLAAGASTSSGIITGSGTTNYVARWTPDGATLGTGLIYDDGVNLGIGTASPIYRLDVTRPASAGAHMRLNTAGNHNPYLDYSIMGTMQFTSAVEKDDGSYYLSNAASSVLLNVKQNGNVGIGTTTPAEKLHVSNGNISINNAYKYRFSGSDSNWELGYESGGPSSSFFGFNAAVLQTVYGDDPNYGYIIENTLGNSIFEIEGQTGKAYFAGSVGIGIAPEVKLHVNSPNTGALVDVLKIDNGGGSPGTEAGLVFETGLDRIARISAAHESGDRGPLKFWTASSQDNLTERMRITQDGVVRVNNIAGTGNRPVYVDPSGNLVTTSGASNTPTSGYSLMDGTVWNTNEGTVRVLISSNTLYVRSYDEGGTHLRTHTIANVYNAKVLVTITNDDDGNSCGEVSRVLSFTRTNGQGEQSQSSDMGCPASDGHMQTIIIFFNPS